MYHYELELREDKPAFTIRSITPSDDKAMADVFTAVVNEFGAEGTPVGGAVAVLDDEVGALLPFQSNILPPSSILLTHIAS